MINNDKLIQALEPIAPSEELVEKVLRRDFARPRRRRLIKRVKYAAAAVLCAVLLTAGGYIDLSEIFRGTILFPGSGDYSGHAENVAAWISDEDYEVHLRGITGGTNTANIVIEIARKDGVSVAEYLGREFEDGYNNTCWVDMLWQVGGSTDYYINERGNPEVMVNASEAGLSGRRLNFAGDTLVLMNEYFSYPGVKSGDIGIDEIKSDPDKYKDFLLLPLRWEISFDYRAAEKLTSGGTSYRAAPGEGFNAFIYENSFPDEDNIREKPVAVKEISVTSAGVTVKWEEEAVPVPADSDPETYVFSDSKNSFALIMKDGSRQPFRMTSRQGEGGEPDPETDIYIMYYTAEGVYFDGEDYSTAIYPKVSKASAVEINGVSFELE